MRPNFIQVLTEAASDQLGLQTNPIANSHATCLYLPLNYHALSVQYLFEWHHYGVSL